MQQSTSTDKNACIEKASKDIDAEEPKFLSGRIKFAAIIAGLTVSIVALFLISQTNYLLFHGIVEVFAIAIAVAIFVIAWNSRGIMENNYLLFLGIAFLFVAGFSLLHTLAYRGMGVFPTYGANLATQLWIITRYIFSISLLVAVLFVCRKIHVKATFASYSLISILLLASVFYWGNFPQAYVEDAGLTLFKISSEYIIAGILGASIIALFQYRNELGRRIVNPIILSMALSIVAEMAFTLYVDTYGITNVVGHLLIVVSFYLIYKALVETALSKPYQFLFRSLKQSENKLANRAEELTQTNMQLEKALAERKVMSEQLEQYGKRLELLVEKKTMQLRDAERLAAIGETAGMVGHDIRNPLQAVVSELYLQRQEVTALPDGEAKLSLQESIRNIETNLYYIDKIVADLQDYSRPIVPLKQKIEIEKIIEHALTIVSIPDNIKILISLDKELPMIEADAVMMRRIISNLIQNAVQAMPKGGELSISARHKDYQVLISIGDTGEGMSMEAQGKIFTPLFTTKSKGQGFGLAVVKRLTEAQGGTVNYQTQQGKGTTFTIQLPT
jgi:signal transduction histidine kinase